MAPLAGTLLTYLALAASGAPGVAHGSTDEICVAPNGVCALPVLDGAQFENWPVELSTPAVVDCAEPKPAPRTTAGATSELGGSTAVEAPVSRVPVAQAGGCSPPTIDFHYRVSRLPESERSTGSIAPARGRRINRAALTVSGVPSDRGGTTTPVLGSPAAMTQALVLPTPAEAGFAPIAATQLFDRSLKPPVPPPRA